MVKAQNINMLKYFLLIALSLKGLCPIAQKLNQIKYILPDKVEIFLDSCIKQYRKNFTFYFILGKDSEYYVSMGVYNKEKKNEAPKWAIETNRFLIINKKNFPLIFDYDTKFALIDSNLGQFGKRDGNIKRVKLLFHGITVSFKSNGLIIKTSKW